MILNEVNEFLGTNFTTKEIGEIYTALGNNVDRKLCIKFIESDYDMSILEQVE